MSRNLSIDDKTILKLFEERNTRFLIPDYQRPYAWDKDECLTLWNDILSFASPDIEFNQDDEYFLGSIVVFKNNRERLEVIDGQQRLITILLILRAFYEAMKDFNNYDWCREVRKNIGKCIWETNEQGEPYTALFKLDSEVATDDDREILRSILRDGATNDDNKDKYSRNFRLFQEKINEFIENIRTNYTGTDFSQKFTVLPSRILNNCILIIIQSEGENGQNNALRIFSTLNDRGKPLSDSDIFKVQLYKAFSADGKKDWFVERWKELEALCEKIFSSLKNNITPMDELFNRYMHYERAVQEIKDNTQLGLRAFYGKENYKLLRINYELVFSNLRMLADFWYSVYVQDESKFSERVLKRLFVLNYAPNSMWTLITSVYFIHNADADGALDEEKFYNFLGKITAFIWAFVISKPNSSVSNLRTPIYKEMINIIHDKEVVFNDDKFYIDDLELAFERYKFSGRTKITRSMLAWWAMNFRGQGLLEITKNFEIEHIQKKGGKGVDIENYESLGNQSLLEAKIRNALSASFEFVDKKNYYLGRTKIRKSPTQIFELWEIADTKNNFNVKEINQRNKKIKEGFIAFISHNQLTK